MTYTPAIYDWREDVQPEEQVFRAGGISVQGGMTLGGISVENPEPGGRAELQLVFPRFALPSANLNASWTISRILNGAIMRVRLWTPSVQLLSDAALGITTTSGVLWSNGLGWAGNIPWRANPSAAVYASAAKGASSVQINMSALGQVLKIGHVVGFFLSSYDFAHVVTDISYSSGNIATVQISPPLRRAVTTSDRMLFRPSMLVTCTNAREVAGNFRWGDTMALNSARLIEAMV